MSKVIVEREDMVAIADGVRESIGSSDDMTLAEINSNLATVNAEAVTQADLIAQISAVLDGKVGGGGGGAAVETCTVTISDDSDGTRFDIVALLFDDPYGSEGTTCALGDSFVVVKNSPIILSESMASYSYNIELVGDGLDTVFCSGKIKNISGQGIVSCYICGYDYPDSMTIKITRA